MLDAVTTKFYEGILAPDEWTDGLRLLQIHLGAVAFHQLAISCKDFSVVQSVVASIHQTEVPSEKVLEFERHYAAQDVRFPAMWGTREGGIWLDHDHFSASIFERSPIYTEFLASAGVRHTVSVPLRDGVESRDFLGLMRAADQAPFGAEEQALLAHLLPQIVQANKLRHRASELAKQAMLGTAALDMLPQCVAVVDWQCQLHYCNVAAQRTLGQMSGWTVCHGRLQAHLPQVQEQLARYVDQACQSGHHARAHVLRLGALTDAAAPGIHVLPLQPSHPLARQHHERPYALLVWAVDDIALQASQITTLLGLSDTEARLALMLAAGRTVKDFAQVHGCSWHTARTHAKNLLRKTGCHRTYELVELVRSLAWG